MYYPILSRLAIVAMFVSVTRHRSLYYTQMAPSKGMIPNLHADAAEIAVSIQMLVFAAGELAGIWQQPVHPAAGHRERMAADCFLLHFRTLSGFLGQRAADYGATIDAGLASMLLDLHIFVEQAIGSDGQMGTKAVTRHEVARMLAGMEEALRFYFSELEPEKLGWFLGEEDTVNALCFIEKIIPMLAGFPATQPPETSYN